MQPPGEGSGEVPPPRHALDLGCPPLLADDSMDIAQRLVLQKELADSSEGPLSLPQLVLHDQVCMKAYSLQLFCCGKASSLANVAHGRCTGHKACSVACSSRLACS